ncbi:hypothetical protein, partial [Burkholderia pseudomallei]|uniref:hypothetical protein n=1 Tax=Burkholderia pseudomallei TaxID=28450 RepID=UPI00160509E1
HFKLEPLVVFRHEKTPKGQIYVQLLGFSSSGEYRAPFFCSVKQQCQEISRGCEEASLAAMFDGSAVARVQRLVDNPRFG